MTKHSKNNTASSIFSYAEYKKLDYGTKRQRLGNESMRRFDCCALCLQRAREPVACNEGHLFCKECVYSDLLTQKKDIKRQKDSLEALTREAEAEKAKARAAARERVLLDFERGQLGFGSVASSGAQPKEADKDAGTSTGAKRKLPFEFDAGKAEALAREAEEVALKQIEKEQAEALRAKLPDFWLPSLTPTYSSTGPPSSLSDIKVQTTCKGGSPSHPLALKNLIPVSFTVPKPGGAAAAASLEEGETRETPARKEDEQEPICPSCKKNLSNNTRMFLMRPCSHVVCKTCTDTLIIPAAQCIVCDVLLKVDPVDAKKEKDKQGAKGAEKKGKGGDIIELKREGTGYAGGGLAETSKAGIAFQG